MADGNWIMSGIRVAKRYDVTGNPPPVAINHGDDFTQWDLIVIPVAQGVEGVWGESTVVVSDATIINVARWGDQARALVAASDGFGRNWTPSQPSNLPMATSKPYTGTLSTGQRYLICTTTADSAGARRPLTVTVTRTLQRIALYPMAFPKCNLGMSKTVRRRALKLFQHRFTHHRSHPERSEGSG